MARPDWQKVPLSAFCSRSRHSMKKDSSSNVEEAVSELKGKIDRFNEISAELANPDADYDNLLSEMGKLQEAIDAADGWDLENQLEQAMDALRCPPSDLPVTNLSGG